MTRDDFQPGDRVIDRQTRRKGTVVEDEWGVCAEDEVPVQFDRGEGYEGTDWRRLVKLSLAN